jgi:thioesterase domain-containing protein
MALDLTAVEAYLHEHIPLSRALGLKVTGYDGKAVRLWAPLAPNLNHRQTAFGGSLSALGILAGWTLLHIKLGAGGDPPQLVIQRSETDYSVPVDSDFTAVCALPAGPNGQDSSGHSGVTAKPGSGWSAGSRRRAGCGPAIPAVT